MIFGPRKMPNHAEIAVRQLENARQELLSAQRRLESELCAVEILKKRVARLDEYVKQNPVPVEQKKPFLKREPAPIPIGA